MKFQFKCVEDFCSREDKDTLTVFVIPKDEIDFEKLSKRVCGNSHCGPELTELAGKNGSFDGDLCTCTMIRSHPKLGAFTLIGAGNQDCFSRFNAMEIGACIASKSCQKCPEDCYTNVHVVLPPSIDPEFVPSMCYGAMLRCYRFIKYKTEKGKKSQGSGCCDSEECCTTITIFHCGEKKDNETIKYNFENCIMPQYEGVKLARDLSNEPANVLTTTEYSSRIKKELEILGVRVKIIGEKELEELGMRALLAVGQGSPHDSQVVIMEWLGAENPNEQIMAFLGKGVVFDSGGISIKPANGMWEMKHDMSGSSAVVGAIKAIAKLKLKVNVVGVVGIVENAVDGAAQRPGDIVKSSSGKTIEVLNTDAEGRLVLADILTHVQKAYKDQLCCVIDLATLTGSIIVAIGKHIAGAFGNDQELLDCIIKLGNCVGERLWDFPMDKEYGNAMKSDIADIKNISASGFGAGSITAAKFLENFIESGTKWVHLDIAGTSWNDSCPCSINPKGATGFGTRLLIALAMCKTTRSCCDTKDKNSCCS